MGTPNTPLWEVFIRSRNGLAHKHCGSLHAADAKLASSPSLANANADRPMAHAAE